MNENNDKRLFKIALLGDVMCGDSFYALGSGVATQIDRFGHMFFRLVENGLTRRDEPIAPLVDEPLRFPDYDREREIVFGK